jgi:hypothetical protein
LERKEYMYIIVIQLRPVAGRILIWRTEKCGDGQKPTKKTTVMNVKLYGSKKEKLTKSTPPTDQALAVLTKFFFYTPPSAYDEPKIEQMVNQRSFHRKI